MTFSTFNLAFLLHHFFTLKYFQASTTPSPLSLAFPKVSQCICACCQVQFYSYAIFPTVEESMFYMIKFLS